MSAASNKVNFYNEFNDYSIKPDELIKGLKPEFYPKDPRYVSIPLAIPSIIRRIYKDLVPYVTHSKRLVILVDLSYYRIEKICKCLGYELRGYNELDLSGLDQLLAKNTGTELIRKRRIVPSSPPSKRRRRNPLPSSPQGKMPCKTSFKTIQILGLTLQMILLKILMDHIRQSIPHLLHRHQLHVQILQLISQLISLLGT